MRRALVVLFAALAFAPATARGDDLPVDASSGYAQTCCPPEHVPPPVHILGFFDGN